MEATSDSVRINAGREVLLMIICRTLNGGTPMKLGYCVVAACTSLDTSVGVDMAALDAVGAVPAAPTLGRRTLVAATGLACRHAVRSPTECVPRSRRPASPGTPGGKTVWGLHGPWESMASLGGGHGW